MFAIRNSTTFPKEFSDYVAIAMIFGDDD